MKKRRNLMMSAALMCGLFCVAFTFDSHRIHWLWKGYEPVAYLLAGAALAACAGWYRAARSLKREPGG